MRAVLLPLAAGYGLVWWAARWAQATHGEDVSESIAALVSAVIGVAGVRAGHNAGRQRHAADAAQPVAKAVQHIAPGQAMVFVLGWVALCGASSWLFAQGVKWAAVAALAAVGIGVTGIHVVHDLWQKPRTWSRVGPCIIASSLALGTGTILFIPKLAEGFAALFAAGVAIGGTQVGHVGGYGEDPPPAPRYEPGAKAE
jgi:hypothetical protein